MNSHTLPRMGRPLLPEADSKQRPTIRITEQRSRPVSLYDNLRGGGGSLGMMTASSTGQLPMEYSPSQAVYLSTTVPQNIAGGNIAGRHAPTRNSLRHSRMIVLSRTGQVSRKYHPPIMRHHKLATGLASLQLLMGIAITTLAVWLLLWAPHLRARDIPYWSGVPLLTSGVFGLLLLCCCRKEYPGMPLGFFVFSIKALSVLLSVVAGCACFCASVFSLLHLIFLSQMSCQPPHALYSTCVCRTVQALVNETVPRVYHYTDLNCGEVGILVVLLIGFVRSQWNRWNPGHVVCLSPLE